jgi:hypothetical protein
MSEFSDLVASVVRCADEIEQLPLYVVVAFSNGRLEAMWAKSHDPNAMAKLLVLTYADLPASLAVDIAERAAQKIAKPTWDEDRVDKIIRELGYQLDGISYSSILEIEGDAERYSRTKGLSQRQRSAWYAISSAITAVRFQTEELEPGEHRYMSGITSKVTDTVYHAWTASVRLCLNTPRRHVGFGATT